MSLLRRLPLLAALAVAVAACGGATIETLTPDGDFTSVSLTNPVGSVTITGDDDEPAGVDAESDDDPAYTLEVVDGVLVVEHTCDTDDCGVDYTVTVPQSVDVTVVGGTGVVVVQNVVGAVSVSATTGNVTLRSVEGEMTAGTDTGNVLGISLTGPVGIFSAETGSVDVSYTDPVERIEATTETGNITVQVPGAPYRVEASTDTGSIDVQVDTDDAADRSLVLTTNTGNVTVYNR